MSISASVVNISRGSLHDGKGVRTVVYLKGCNMHCKWCHNPEGISSKPQLLFVENKCIHCGKCIKTCPGQHILQDLQHIYIQDGCIACGRCAQNCPVNALELCGKDKTAQEVLKEILKDKQYYDTSSGGVTFSGGECLLHFDFMKEIVQLCKGAGISVTVESAMNIPWKNVEPLLPYVDSFYVDIKHMDSEVHKKYAGCDNSLILENIQRLASVYNSILIRIPLIPNVNDCLDNLVKTAKFAKSCSGGINGLELLKYNILGESKYALLHEDYVSFSDEAQSNTYMDEICQQINKSVNEDNFAFYLK